MSNVENDMLTGGRNPVVVLHPDVVKQIEDIAARPLEDNSLHLDGKTLTLAIAAAGTVIGGAAGALFTQDASAKEASEQNSSPPDNTPTNTLQMSAEELSERYGVGNGGGSVVTQGVQNPEAPMQGDECYDDNYFNSDGGQQHEGPRKPCRTKTPVPTHTEQPTNTPRSTRTEQPTRTPCTTEVTPTHFATETGIPTEPLYTLTSTAETPTSTPTPQDTDSPSPSETSVSGPHTGVAVNENYRKIISSKAARWMNALYGAVIGAVSGVGAGKGIDWFKRRKTSSKSENTEEIS